MSVTPIEGKYYWIWIERATVWQIGYYERSGWWLIIGDERTVHYTQIEEIGQQIPDHNTPVKKEIPNETELWQIVRYHSSDIRIDISFTPDFGVPMYYVQMTIRRPYQYARIYRGTNLSKRYAQLIRDLKKIYGDNLYKYDAMPGDPKEVFKKK